MTGVPAPKNSSMTVIAVRGWWYAAYVAGGGVGRAHGTSSSMGVVVVGVMDACDSCFLNKPKKREVMEVDWEDICRIWSALDTERKWIRIHTISL